MKRKRCDDVWKGRDAMYGRRESERKEKAKSEMEDRGRFASLALEGWATLSQNISHGRVERKLY